ncbi:MAG: NBR1-Ig-like domain-containing protein, partial [Omnitrophica WOR_2 bacterium]
MFKSFIRSYGLFLIALLFLSACTMPLSSGSTPSSQDIIYTAAAQTVEAQLTQAGVNLESTATPQAEAPTATLSPAQPTATQTQEPPQATATTRPTAKPATATSVPVPCDRAQFVKDVTYPDGTEVMTGSDFTKTWRLKNTGTCTWDSGYSLVFKGRSKMSGPSDQQLTDGTVEPGETVDVSVDLTAPSTPGSYEGDWMLQNDSGNNFGIGNDAKSFFWVKITAVEGTRVSMDTGATTAYVEGHLAKNDSATYLVGAKANQYMMVTINTDDQSLYLQIEAPDGTILLDSSDESNTWQGKLPDDG